MDDLKSAESAFLKAIRIMPRHPPAHTNLGILLFRQGKTDEAVEHLRLALELNPADQQASRQLEMIGKMRNGQLRPQNISHP
ncbi:MAG: tetratricopeptide repeat protein [bacterium]